MKKIFMLALFYPFMSATGQDSPLTAASFYGEYMSNELGADAKYKNKTVVLDGLVQKVSRGLHSYGDKEMDAPVITLLPGVYAFLSKSSEDAASRLKPFDNVVLSCVGVGLDRSQYPRLDKCDIVTNNHPETKKDQVKPVKVSNSPWDGSVEQVISYQKRESHHPDTLAFIEWGKVESKNGGYSVRCKFKEKSSNGNYLTKEEIFSLNKAGDVIGVKSISK